MANQNRVVDEEFQRVLMLNDVRYQYDFNVALLEAKGRIVSKMSLDVLSVGRAEEIAVLLDVVLGTSGLKKEFG